MVTKKSNEGNLNIQELSTQTLEVDIIGESPIIMNAMSAKTMQDLLLPPKQKKTRADKEQTVRHDPLAEYRRSCYLRQDTDEGPTAIIFPAASIKAAMMNAALELPGTAKSQIGRLVWVEGSNIDIYGKPQMFMSVVKSAGMNRTPDVRTRAIIAKWCTRIKISYVTPALNETTLLRLLNAAGMISGLGDFRQDKGKGNFGRFRCAKPEEVELIMDSCSRKGQLNALDKIDFYDVETQRLYEWFCSEKKARGM